MTTITIFFRGGENEEESCPSSIHCVKSIQRKELTSRRWLCLRCPEGGAQKEMGHFVWVCKASSSSKVVQPRCAKCFPATQCFCHLPAQTTF